MQKKEASFSTQFGHYLMSGRFKSPWGPTELKDTRGKERFPFKELKEAQVNHLLACTTKKGIVMRTIGATGIPDLCPYKNSPAYVAIKYPKEFFIIGINTYVLERGRSKSKSLTRERARDICIKSVRTKSY